MTKRAAIYARYSSHNQREESIEIQLDRCRCYAKEKGWSVVGEYCDYATSGRTSDREQFQRMMRDASNGMFDVVVIWKVTRIMRNRDEMALCRRELNKHGVDIAYAGENFPGGANGLLMLGMLEVLAEWESAQTAERIRDGVRKNAERVQASGVRIFGYTVDDDDKFQINENEAAAVRLAFKMAAQGKRISEIVEALSGYRSKWGNPIGWQSVMNMLRNERYAGVYSYAGVRKEDGMPAIVDHDTFDRVQEVLDARRPKPRKGNHDYTLVGRLFDIEGQPMTGTSATGRNGAKHYYYRTKGGKRVRCDVIERVVSDAVAAALADSATREKIADTFERFQDTLEEAPKRTELAKVKAAIKRIEKAIEDGLPFDRDRLLELHAKKEELEKERICRVQPKKFSREQVLRLLESAAQMDYQRAIDIFVKQVVWSDEGAAVEFRFDDEAPAAPSKERLAQINAWWRRCGDTPTIAVSGGFVTLCRQER